jgi:glycosyltransferase involved in cell wall biosynthesis
MSGTAMARERTTSAPIRGWADIVDEYRASVAQNRKPSRGRRPKVSVCVVANRSGGQLQTTINSVLAQRFGEMEIVVVDSEGSALPQEILAATMDSRLRFVRAQAGTSRSESFNVAVLHSRGQFVKLLCDEDTLDPDCVAAQASVLDINRDVVLVAGDAEYVDDAGEAVERRPRHWPTMGAHAATQVVKTTVRSGGNPVGPLPAAMFRRTDFSRCGGLALDPSDSPELDLWIRILRFGEFFYAPETLVSIRRPRLSIADSTTMPRRLAERIRFTRRVKEDPVWGVTALDRAVGHVRFCQDLLRHRCRALLPVLNLPPRRRSQVRPPDSAGIHFAGRGDGLWLKDTAAPWSPNRTEER